MRAANTTGMLLWGKTWVSPSFQEAPGFAFFPSVRASWVFSSWLAIFLGHGEQRWEGVGNGTWKTAGGLINPGQPLGHKSMPSCHPAKVGWGEPNRINTFPRPIIQFTKLLDRLRNTRHRPEAGTAFPV